MFRKLTLSFLLTVCSIAVSNFSFAANVTINGASNTNYTLGAGDTLFIGTNGNYTGVISGLSANNRVIVVAGGGVFNPSGLNPNNGVVCKMHIYGTFTYSSPFTTNTNFMMDIYAGGLVNLAAMNTKGRDQVWTNHSGGTMNFSGDVVINGGTDEDNNNVFINHATINANGNFQMNSGSVFINYKDFNVAGNYKANGGKLRNEGNFVVTGLLEINSGATPIENYCRLQALGGIDISNSTFFNYSYVWAKNSEIEISSGGITNINIPGALPPIIHGASYKQTGGSVTGPALMYFYGTTTISGGTIGVTGVTTDTIKMYDITRASPSTILDVQSAGTVRPNVIYNAWGIPDSNRTYLIGCSVEIFLEIPLAIHWKSFDVILLNTIPQLIWSAEFDRSTIFEIQRSYDGSSFSSIKTAPSEVGRSEYRFDDELVNVKAPVVYYRIKATQISGEEKYTETKMVRFSNKPGNIFTAPNPFTNNFIINYTAGEKEIITIKIFNVNGQQKFLKNVVVNNGSNTIHIAEAAQFAKGIYVIQVSNGHSIISSGKIIKQ